MISQTFYYSDFCHFLGSTLVSSIYFNDRAREMLVHLNCGRVYLYMNVDQQKFDDFKNSNSPGAFYNSFMKNSKNVKSAGFVGYLNDINLRGLSKPQKEEVPVQQYEVTVQVTVTTTVRVTAENFDGAAKLALDEVGKIEGAVTNEVVVTGVKKL